MGIIKFIKKLCNYKTTMNVCHILSNCNHILAIAHNTVAFPSCIWKTCNKPFRVQMYYTINIQSLKSIKMLILHDFTSLNNDHNIIRFLLKYCKTLNYIIMHNLISISTNNLKRILHKKCNFIMSGRRSHYMHLKEGRIIFIL